MAGAAMNAFREGDVQKLKDVLSSSDDISFLSNSPEPLPCLAARQGASEMLDVILAVDPWSAVAMDASFRTPLHYACMQGNREVARMLLERKPGRVACNIMMKQQDDFKMTPITCAILSGREELVEDMLEAGSFSGIDLPSKDGLYPLQLACSKGMSRVVSSLCSQPHGEELAQRLGRDGNSLLHRAVLEGHTGIVKMLLERKLCPPELLDASGSTAMELAVSLGHTDAAWVLYDLVPRKIARESIQKLIERKIEEETMKMFGCRVESFDINAYEEGELEEEVCRAVEERGPWMNLLNIFPRGLDSLLQVDLSVDEEEYLLVVAQACRSRA